MTIKEMYIKDIRQASKDIEEYSNIIKDRANMLTNEQLKASFLVNSTIMTALSIVLTTQAEILKEIRKIR